MAAPHGCRTCASRRKAPTSTTVPASFRAPRSTTATSRATTKGWSRSAGCRTRSGPTAGATRSARAIRPAAAGGGLWRKSSARRCGTSGRALFLSGDLPDRRDQVVEVVGLHDRGLPALVEEPAGLVAGAVAGDEHEPLGELRALLRELLVQGAAAEPGHLQVRHHRVEAVARGAEPLDRLEPLLHRHHFLPLPLEQQAHGLAIHRVVVHHEDAELGERGHGGRGARERREHALRKRDHHFRPAAGPRPEPQRPTGRLRQRAGEGELDLPAARALREPERRHEPLDRKSTRLNSSHGYISYAVFCLKKKNKTTTEHNLTIVTST